jgi:hypothetical protein
MQDHTPDGLPTRRRRPPPPVEAAATPCCDLITFVRSRRSQATEVSGETCVCDDAFVPLSLSARG